MKKEINPEHCWITPLKGTPEHAQVLDIIARSKPKAVEARNVERRKEAAKKLAEVGKEFAERRAKAVKDRETAEKLKGISEKLKKIHALKQLGKLAKKVKEAKEAKDPKAIFTKWASTSLEEIESLGWEDLPGPSKPQAAVWKKFMKTFVELKSGTTYCSEYYAGPVNDEDLRALEGEEEYYRAVGEYGGTEWTSVTKDQVIVYALYVAFLSQMKEPMDIDSNADVYLLNTYAISADDIEEKLEKMAKESGGTHLYYLCHTMPEKVKEAIQNLYKIKLMYKAVKRAEQLEDEIKDAEDEDGWNDYYGTTLKDANVAVKLCFIKQ